VNSDAELTPFGKRIKGVWRNIKGVCYLSERYFLTLECGHKFMVHAQVRQFNGCLFKAGQVAFFCTQCDPSDFELIEPSDFDDGPEF